MFGESHAQEVKVAALTKWVNTQPDPKPGQWWKRGSRIVQVIGPGKVKRTGEEGIAIKPEIGKSSVYSIEKFLKLYTYIGRKPKKVIV